MGKIMQKANKRWLNQYPAGVPQDLPANVSGQNLLDVIDDSCARYAHQPCLFSLGGRLSYEGLYQHSQQVAAWLKTNGLEKGDRVALMMPNIMPFVVAMVGVLRAGGVVMTVNPLYTPRELQEQLQDARPKFIFVAQPFVGTLARARAPDSLQYCIVTRLGDLQPWPRRLLINSMARWRRQEQGSAPLPGSVLSFARVLQAGRRAHETGRFSPLTISAQDSAFLLYTGGTTGTPKGVLLSHGNLVSNLEQITHWLGARLRPGQETVLTALPLYHIFSLTGNCLLFLKLGGLNLLIPDARKTSAIVGSFRRHKITAFTGVNTLFLRLLAHPAFQQLDFGPLRLVIGGGTAVTETVAARWEQLTGQPLLQAYGLTETAPAICINPADGQHVTASVGLPLPATEVEIRDAAGRVLGPDVDGEICVRGPQVMQGYYGRAEATGAAFCARGFFRTGDIGFMDSRGFVYLKERMADIINVSGFNVYPGELEAVIAACPGVQAVAAVGISCPQTGQKIRVFIQSSDRTLTAQDIAQFCAQRLASYKCPREIVFCTELPLSHIGKVLRRKLRQTDA